MDDDAVGVALGSTLRQIIDGVRLDSLNNIGQL